MGNIPQKRSSRKQKNQLGGTRKQRQVKRDPQVDLREQTFNRGERGPIEQVSTKIQLITCLRSIMVDIDTKHLSPKLYKPGKCSPPWRLYHQTVRKWLDRHPLWQKVEVRHTGSGLHLLFNLERHVEFRETAERDRWVNVVRVIQSCLPSDPNAPGLNALTRPVGSINSKNGKKVKSLRKGEPVAQNEVLAFVEEVNQRPFFTVAHLLYGSERITPALSRSILLLV